MLKHLKDLLAGLPATHLLVALLWFATLAVIVTILTGCGQLNYIPQKITTTTTTELPHDQATENDPQRQ